MKRSLLTWCIVLLLLVAAVIFLLYSKGNRHSNSLSQAQNPSFSASQSSASHSASTNALKAAAASAKTNRFAWRLHNTDKTIGQLVHDPHAILLENAFIDTSKKLDLIIPKNLQSRATRARILSKRAGRSIRHLNPCWLLKALRLFPIFPIMLISCVLRKPWPAN